MNISQVVATGSYLPEKIVKNTDLESLVDTSDQWIRERTGIVQRHIAEKETAGDLAEQAALKAIEMAGMKATDIDCIIVATTTPDKVFPSTACLLQKRLGIRGCPAFDIQAVCTGFIYALGIADRFIRVGDARCVLVVGSEVLSKIIDWSDRNTCVLFGDGAGAFIVQTGDEPGIYSTHLHADGTYEDLLHAPYSEAGNFIQMKGNEVFKMAVKTLGRIVDETLAANNFAKSDIDWLVPHQANSRIIEATAKKLDMPMSQVVQTVHEHGNTSAASIPLAFDQAVRDGRIKKGDTVMLEAFGGGFTWGSALLRF